MSYFIYFFVSLNLNGFHKCGILLVKREHIDELTRSYEFFFFIVFFIICQEWNV